MSSAELKDPIPTPDTNTNTPLILSALAQAETAEHKQTSGLAEFEGLTIDSAKGFPALDPATFARLREELTLCKDLPKPPSLGNLSFLLGKRNNDLRELFEDNWTAACLNCAAAAEVHVELARSTEPDEEGKTALDPSELVFKAIRRLILTAANVPARSLEIYKYIATKSTLKATTKPGSRRDEVISTEEAKTLNAKLDTATKLSKKLYTPRFHRPRQNRYTFQWQGIPGSYQHTGRRGGRHRGRGGRRGRRGRH